MEADILKLLKFEMGNPTIKTFLRSSCGFKDVASAAVLAESVCFRSKNSSENRQQRKLPPGPQKLPLIGNMHNLIASRQHYALRDLSRKDGPLIHLKLGEVEAIVVSSSRLAKEITKTHDQSFADRASFVAWNIISYDGMSLGYSPYNENWRQLRRICVQEALSTKQVRAFRPLREEEFYHLISNISISEQIGKPFDLTWNILSTTTRIVSRAAFGKIRSDHDKFVDLIKEIFRTGARFNFADFFPSYKILHALTRPEHKMLKLREKMDFILDDVINEHMMNIRNHENTDKQLQVEDITDVLLRIKKSGDLQYPFVINNIKGILFDMFIAGTETSATTVEWAMSELMKNPHVMAKAKYEIRQAFKGKKKIGEDDIQCLKYLKLVIKETLRLHPPGPLLIPRQCREECEVDGYEISVGTMVFINAWAIARDSEYWDDAESFIPERFEDNPIDFSGRHYEYLPFGSGRRMCPGSAFGLANVELPLALMLYHFDWELPNGIKSKDFDMTEAPGISVSRKTHLCLIPTSFLVV